MVVEQPVLGYAWLGTGIHQQEAAGAVCIFRHPLAQAGLAKQRRLLVSGDPGDGNLYAADVIGAVNLAAGTDLRQHGFGNLQPFQNLIIPAQLWMSNSIVREALV